MAMSAIGIATGREEATRDEHEAPARRLVLARELAGAPHGRERAGEAQRQPARWPSAARALVAGRRRRDLLAQLPAEQPLAEERHQRRDERDRRRRG